MANKKKIWYISKYAISPKYGKETRQYLYSKYFAKNINFNVTLISSCSSGAVNIPKFKGLFYKDIQEYVKCYLLKGPAITNGFSIKRIISWIIFEINLYRFIRRSHEIPDVVIISSLSLLTIFNGIYLKSKFKSKFILEIRDIWPLTIIDIGGFSKNNLFVKILAWIERLGYKKADIIVGTMPNLKEHIKKTIQNDFKFAYLPMGIDIENCTTEKKEWTFPKEKFIIGYAGAIGYANQIEDILLAAEILKENKYIIFAFLGDGTCKENLKNKYKHLNNIIWLQKIEKKYVNSFLVNCDLLINTLKNRSIYQYGISPNKWIDYMYAAKPIVVSYSGYPCIINDAKCGEFIEAENPKLLADVILKYSKKPKEELINIGQKGKNYLINNLSYKKLSEKYIELF